MTPSFQLNKWYLDCVSETGETLIGYSAELAWKFLNFSYASCLEFDNCHPPRTETTLGRKSPPTLTGEGITWTSPGLSCSGSWRPLMAATLPPLNLYEDDTGSITWHCLQPLSAAVMCRDGEEISGLGYAEQLVMTVAPWRLPIKELHWGRFLAPNAYVVWIEWRGSHPLTLVYLNGAKVENANISRSTLSWEGGGLELSELVSLRSGPLVKTALAKVPGVSSIFPGNILHTHECKWRSRGKLLCNGETHTGWAIHEIVQFKQVENE